MTKTGRSVELFSTTADMVAVLRAVASSHPICFLEAGAFDDSAVPVLERVEEVEASMARNRDPWLTFLALPKGDLVRPRAVPQRRGGLVYFVDQRDIPRSVSVRPGASGPGNVLLSGQIGTSSRDPDSLRLFAAFRKVIQQQFECVRSSWVGPEAARLLDAGWRLTHGLKAPDSSDLRRA